MGAQSTLPTQARRCLACWALLSTAAVAKHPRGGSPRIPLPVNPNEHPWQTTLCFVDVAQSTYSLGEAASLLNSAVINCPNSTTAEERAVCSASVGNAMAALTYVVAYLAAALSSCMETVTTNVTTFEASCAADTAGFLNGLTTAWGAASSLASGTCNNVSVPGGSVNRRLFQEEKRQAFDRASAASRKLPMAGKGSGPSFPGQGVNPAELLEQLAAKDDQDDRDERNANTNKALCFFDVGQATFYLTRTVVAIHGSMEVCAPSEIVDEEDKMLCTVSIAGMLGAIIYTALYINLLFVHCPIDPRAAPACSADIITVLTVFTSLISSSADFELSCGELLPPKAIHFIEDVPRPNRRLREEALHTLRRFATGAPSVQHFV